MNTPASTMRPITGRFVLIAVVAFFAVVISVNVVMMRLAIATLPGTEVDSAYAASLAYQKEIQAAQQQAMRNWKVDAHIERGADGVATLNIDARDGDGAPLTGLAVFARLERPTDRRADQAFELAASGSAYRGTARGVAAGQWELVIEADANGQRLFRSRNRIVLK
ncbi:FixH family protein [Bradyrhizobium sp. NP1]|uniref:FixH family protein n=1 Tax=Bradyrhizobium sp. NP1 TaxID=3049772 RepID=UPI0025A582C3|nr:FixH family protein [Bradyrhizobium sp. NP1]WJR80196.1 FixH family protein [Bradyrhizobium sp. NP1]